MKNSMMVMMVVMVVMMMSGCDIMFDLSDSSW